jgi:HAD superfamily hydrolase (TIGR01509 family)
MARAPRSSAIWQARKSRQMQGGHNEPPRPPTPRSGPEFVDGAGHLPHKWGDWPSSAPTPIVMTELVIFDCDGVLVDSETISVSVLTEIVRKAGVDIGEEQAYRLFLGRSVGAVEDALRKEFALTLTKAQLDGIRSETFRRFRGELKPMAGVAEALSRLQTRRCVASSSSLERIRLSLSLTGLLEMLDPHIYSASMVARGKPAPDLFLHAAKGMGVRPEDCVVVEDSPAGIDAARRAGMSVFAFAGGSHAAHAALERELEALRPDRIFSDMRMLPELVAKTGGRAA